MKLYLSNINAIHDILQPAGARYKAEAENDIRTCSKGLIEAQHNKVTQMYVVRSYLLLTTRCEGYMCWFVSLGTWLISGLCVSIKTRCGCTGMELVLQSCPILQCMTCFHVLILPPSPLSPPSPHRFSSPPLPS